MDKHVQIKFEHMQEVFTYPYLGFHVSGEMSSWKRLEEGTLIDNFVDGRNLMTC